MALNIDATFEIKLTYAFKYDIRNWANFHQSMFKSLKIRTWWDPFIQSRKFTSSKFIGHFVSWQWKSIQNFKRNWLVSSKLTGGIWPNLTRALKNLINLYYNGLPFLVYNVWANKSVLEFCLMALNIDDTFEGKLTFVFKNDLRNLANFH